jgi:CheY-like chemotaxis protein
MPLVLVIDDDPGIRSWIRDVLELEGLAVVSAADGRQGLELASQESPDLAVVDVSMPIMDGMAVSVALRETLGDGFPIVLISADVGVREKAARVGAVASLQKPFSIDELMRAVNGGLPLP